VQHFFRSMWKLLRGFFSFRCVSSRCVGGVDMANQSIKESQEGGKRYNPPFYTTGTCRTKKQRRSAPHHGTGFNAHVGRRLVIPNASCVFFTRQVILRGVSPMVCAPRVDTVSPYVAAWWAGIFFVVWLAQGGFVDPIRADIERRRRARRARGSGH